MMFEPPPTPIAAWVESLPGNCVGERWATFLTPIGGTLKVKIEAWGQIACPGAEPDEMIADHMWNYLPFHGRGFRYIGWCVRPYRGRHLCGPVNDAERRELHAAWKQDESYARETK